MRYGEFLTLHGDGPLVKPRFLLPIGVQNDSRCWGVWIPVNTMEKDADIDIRPPGKSHLIVTPIHPSSWPFTFRLLLRLRHSSGALHRASQILKENEMNILFAACNQSGARHATWNLTVEDMALRRESIPVGKLAPMPSRPSDEEIRKRSMSAVSLTKKLLVRANNCVEELLNVDASKRRDNREGEYFLRSRFLEKRLCSFSREVINDDEIWGKNSGILSKSVYMLPMPNLTHHWRFGSNVHNPIQFRYRHDKGQLEALEPSKFRGSVEKHWGKNSSMLVGSFDTDEHSVRLIPPHDGKGSLVEIQVNYAQVESGNSTSNLICTDGLLNAVTLKLASEPVNLLSVSNVTFSRDTDVETGRISFRGYFEHGKSLNKAEQDLRHKLEEIKPWQLNVKVHAMQMQRAFLSMHQDTARGSDIRRIVHDAVGRAGISVEDVDIKAGNVEQRVISALRHSSMFVQILTKRLDNSDENIGWLATEYGMARALGFRPLIFADTSDTSLNEWRDLLRVPNGVINEFDSRLDTELLEKCIVTCIEVFCGDSSKWKIGNS